MKIPDKAYACNMQLQTRIMVLTLQFTMPALGCIGNHYNIVIFLFQDKKKAVVYR